MIEKSVILGSHSLTRNYFGIRLWSGKTMISFLYLICLKPTKRIQLSFLSAVRDMRYWFYNIIYPRWHFKIVLFGIGCSGIWFCKLFMDYSAIQHLKNMEGGGGLYFIMLSGSKNWIFRFWNFQIFTFDQLFYSIPNLKLVFVFYFWWFFYKFILIRL